jgi:asparagine synthase (glutamine-hydrolysing)
MCGLLFVKQLQTSVTEKDLSVFKKALDLMSYRGPDATHMVQAGPCLLGHVRLSIIDLSMQSNQPFKTKNGFLLFNGEIYNYNDINGNVNSDTKMLAELFNEGVVDCARLEGMYAMLHYHIELDDVIVHRDFFGEKPLYYYIDDNIFIVSSTIKSIRYILTNAGGSSLLLNEAAVIDYLGFGFVREPLTIYKNIYALPSGHSLSFNRSNQLSVRSDLTNLMSSPAVNFKSYMTKALQVSDVPATLLLSGGIDSNYLLHMFHHLEMRPEILIYKHDNGGVDESAQALSHLSKIDQSLLSKVILATGSVSAEDVNCFAHIMEQPSSDGLNLFTILKHLKQKKPNAKLIYTGLGGDEMFGGYNSFKYLKYFKGVDFLRKLGVGHIMGQRFKRFALELSGRFPSFMLFYFLYRLDLATLQACRVDLGCIRDAYLRFGEGLSPYFSNGAEHHPLLGLKMCETMDYMKNQLLRDSDNISMHFGLESRSPFLSRSLMHVQPDFKRGLQQTLLTDYHIRFKKKQGFTVKSEVFLDVQFQAEYEVFFGMPCPRDLNAGSIRKLKNLFLWTRAMV